jgi:CHASE2 domain-containing sensor protein
MNLLQPERSAANPLSIGVFVYQSVFVLIVLVAAGLGVVVLRHSDRQAFVAVTVTIVYFFVVCAAPESYSRFRVPLMPMLCVLAACGLSRLFRYCRLGPKD